MGNTTRRSRLSIMNGIRYPEMFSPKCFKEALEYKPTPEDVIISTYPKCGTTWMQNVVLYILRKGKELEHPTDFMYMAPFIDMVGIEGIQKMPRPGAIKTHLPYSHMPYSSKAKYIFVARNPKDCCVSHYYHVRDDPGYGFWDAEFSEFFELFMAGEVENNDYFDHLLDWYPHRNDPNVFYTTYETMKKDIKNVVLKLAKFLGSEYLDAIEKDNIVYNNIILYSGIDYMKNMFAKLYKSERNGVNCHQMLYGRQYMYNFIKSMNPPHGIPKRQFIRKGIIGDWENHFSFYQKERINKKFFEKMKGTEVLNWFPIE
ncbi:Sulfotransferase 1C4 like protein [Argiope bruennichi]|uniref:Sulfotransferase 1C4 like protein n=1 Tax=Argiope bruennichi TaxID=94029 RepID=A0A8T0E253_ARGBR|nr:Sulfotransferase 1C4 like protein [Argiope bruennichi]